MNLGGVVHLNKTGIIVLGSLIVIIFLYSTSNSLTKDESEMDLINLRKLLEIAIIAAELGGQKVVETKDTMKVERKGSTKEGLQDSVTTADFLSHCAITSFLNHYFTDLKIISEENPVCEKTNFIDYSFNNSLDLPEEYVEVNDITVWIDPLDATQEYTGMWFYLLNQIKFMSVFDFRKV